MVRYNIKKQLLQALLAALCAGLGSTVGLTFAAQKHVDSYPGLNRSDRDEILGIVYRDFTPLSMVVSAVFTLGFGVVFSFLSNRRNNPEILQKMLLEYAAGKLGSAPGDSIESTQWTDIYSQLLAESKKNP